MNSPGTAVDYRFETVPQEGLDDKILTYLREFSSLISVVPPFTAMHAHRVVVTSKLTLGRRTRSRWKQHDQRLLLRARQRPRV